MLCDAAVAKRAAKELRMNIWVGGNLHFLFATFLKILKTTQYNLSASICVQLRRFRHNFGYRSEPHQEGVWFYMATGYLLLARITGPNLKNKKGIGTMARVRKPRRDVAQPIPRVSYTMSNVSLTDPLKHC
jgi:hypothetical protein